MIHGFALLLTFQLSGEAAARGLGLPVPGPVIGLVLIALALGLHLRLRGLASAEVEETAVGRAALALLANLGVLFVPAGAGIMQQFGLLLSNGVALVTALAVSTVLTLLATVWTFVLVKRLCAGRSAA